MVILILGTKISVVKLVRPDQNSSDRSSNSCAKASRYAVLQIVNYYKGVTRNLKAKRLVRMQTFED